METLGFTIVDPLDGAAAASIMSPLRPHGNKAAFTSVTVPQGPTASEHDAVVTVDLVKSPKSLPNKKTMRDFLATRAGQDERLGDLNDANALSAALRLWLRWIAKRNHGRFQLVMTLDEICASVADFVLRLPDDAQFAPKRVQSQVFLASSSPPLVGALHSPVALVTRRSHACLVDDNERSWPLRCAFYAVFGNASLVMEHVVAKVRAGILRLADPSTTTTFMLVKADGIVKQVAGKAQGHWAVDWDAGHIGLLLSPPPIAGGVESGGREAGFIQGSIQQHKFFDAPPHDHDDCERDPAPMPTREPVSTPESEAVCGGSPEEFKHGVSGSCQAAQAAKAGKKRKFALAAQVLGVGAGTHAISMSAGAGKSAQGDADEVLSSRSAANKRSRKAARAAQG